MSIKSSTPILIIVLIVFLMFDGIGQTKSNTKTCVTKDWQINYNLGFTEFYGDVSTNGYFKKFSGEIAFATGVTVRKYISPTFGLGINLWYSGIKSQKDKRASGIPTNYTLVGSYFDGNINLLIDFNSLFWGERYRKLTFYGIIGTGYSTWNSALTDSLTGNIRNSGDTIGSGYYKKGAFVIPVALGINYMISENWALNFEMNLRTILNDDVDVWRDGFKYDQLLYTSIGVSYFINKNSKKRKKRVTVGEGPVKPVSTFDYRISPNQNGSDKKVPEVILIDAPVEKSIIKTHEIIYQVQIFATRNKLPSFDYLRTKFNISVDIYENYQDGIYRYSTGSYLTYKEALNYSRVMKNKGVVDAFVVAYKNDLRISITPKMKK